MAVVARELGGRERWAVAGGGRSRRVQRIECGACGLGEGWVRDQRFAVAAWREGQLPFPGRGRPLHFYTLAAQLGIPRVDTVLQLRDGSGKKLAENDDVVAGQGSLIGNPDSSLFYTPKEDGPLVLTVSDRVRRGGPDMQYRLKVASERPSFQLFTTPENFTVPQGGSADIKVHLVRESGFDGPVTVWLDGMPPGVDAPRAQFRADQLFEPNADGADMIIPEIAFAVHVPASLPPGSYPIRLLGVADAKEKNPGPARGRRPHGHYDRSAAGFVELRHRQVPAIAMTSWRRSRLAWNRRRAASRSNAAVP